MQTNAIFELSMTLDSESFDELFDRIGGYSLPHSDDEECYLDQSLADKGVIVRYRDSQYKKKIFFNVNVGVLMAGKEPSTDRLLKKVRKYAHKYFGSKVNIDDFIMSGVSLITDINVGNHNIVSDYIKVLQRIGKVKGFSPVCYNFLEDTDSFCLSGNSNGIDFLLYDLERLIVPQLECADVGRNELQNVITQTKGIIRAEVRLTKPKAVRHYIDTDNIADQLTELWEHRQRIFLETFARIIPFGDFYKKDKAVDIVRSEIADSTMRRKMLLLLELIPVKKSLWLAQKATQCRDTDKLMRAFAKIDLSPITISKRHSVKYLKSLYSYL